MYIDLLVFGPSVTLPELCRMHAEEIIISFRIVFREQFAVLDARLRPFAHETAFGVYSPIAYPVCVYTYVMRPILFGFHQIYVLFYGFVE